MTKEGMQQSQGGGSAQGGTAGGDLRNMNVGDLIDLANQQQIDVSALNELLSNLQVNPEISSQIGAGDQQAEQEAGGQQQQAGGQQPNQ